eukprot:scaffold123019_cov19-Tisochrysis_lutea.AAC.1
MATFCLGQPWGRPPRLPQIPNFCVEGLDAMFSKLFVTWCSLVHVRISGSATEKEGITPGLNWELGTSLHQDNNNQDNTHDPLHSPEKYGTNCITQMTSNIPGLWGLRRFLSFTSITLNR